MKIHIDFETRSACDIGRAGAWMYSRHYSTVILCVAIGVDGHPVSVYTFSELYNGSNKSYDPVSQLIRNNPQAICEAHNSKFEYAMWQNKMVPLGFPEIPLERWECTAARARVMNLPAALENAGAALDLDIKKDSEGYRVMMWLCRPQKLPKTGRQYWQDLGDGTGYDNDPAKFQKLFSYCANDVEVERLLDSRLKPMSEFEHAVWLEDQRMNLRGIRVDLDLVDAALDISTRLTDAAVIEISQLTGGTVTSFTQRERLHDWLIAQGVVSDRLRADDVEEMLSRTDIPANARRVLEIRRSMARSSVAKYSLIRETADTDERVRDYLLYGGAHTLRWSGQGIQVQNFPRGTEDDMEGLVAAVKTRNIPYLTAMFGDPNHALSNALRGVFIPSEGKELIWADYAAIEARVLMWLAGCETGLQMFRDGVDIYVEMAKRIFKNPNLTKADKFERQMGKKATLGLVRMTGSSLIVLWLMIRSMLFVRCFQRLRISGMPWKARLQKPFVVGVLCGWEIRLRLVLKLAH
jgi:DNA polymerase